METAELKEIKTQIEETQKKNEDYFKLILALVGSVFVIVGFFGFKSITDTRQATLDASKIKAEAIAITSAKTQAELTVREYLKNDGDTILSAASTKVATLIAEKVSLDTSTKVATSTAQEEVRRMFADQREFQRALQSDLETLERQNDTLRARVIELENHIYGTEPDPDKPILPIDKNPEAEV